MFVISTKSLRKMRHNRSRFKKKFSLVASATTHYMSIFIEKLSNVAQVRLNNLNKTTILKLFKRFHELLFTKD